MQNTFLEAHRLLCAILFLKLMNVNNRSGGNLNHLEIQLVVPPKYWGHFATDVTLPFTEGHAIKISFSKKT